MAIGAASQFFMRPSGNDLNGGGANLATVVTNYSNQNAAQLTLTDCTTSGAAATTLSSVTGGFTAAIVGNIVQIASGTNFQTGFYEVITFTDTNNVVLDRTPTSGGAGSVGNMKLGGAFAGIVKARTALAVAGNKLEVMAGTYTAAATIGSVATRCTIRGFNTTPGDCDADPTLTRPVIQAGTNGTAGITLAAAGSTITSIDWYGPSSSLRWAGVITISGAGCTVQNCIFRGDISGGGGPIATSGNYTAVLGNYFNDPKLAAASDGILRHSGGVPAGILIEGNYVKGGTAAVSGGVAYGVANLANADNYWTIRNNVFDSLQIGVQVSQGVGYVIEDNIFWTCTGDSITFAVASTLIRNNLILKSGGYHINPSISQFESPRMDNNFLGSSAMAATSGDYSSNLVTTNPEWVRTDLHVTADPFTSQATGDWTLNNTAGAGAVVRAATLPKRWVGTITLNYRDGGGVQHLDSGGGGSVAIPVARAI